MASLTDNKVKDTYKGLIKTSDSAEITGEVQLSDGDGNTIPVYVNTDSIKFTGKVKDKDGNDGTDGQVLISTGTQVDWKTVKYTHTQSVAGTSWSITHNLGFEPSVSVLISNSLVYAQVTHTTVNSLNITFSSAQSGKAYLV
jgi:hypothetical protein